MLGRIKWFFYNFSSQVEGFHYSKEEIISPILGETTTEIKTLEGLLPYARSYRIQINNNLWVPIVGGENYEGCTIFIESKIDGVWYKNENSVINLNSIKSIKSTGIQLTNLKDKIFLLKEWNNFGTIPYRICLYVPLDKEVNNFFFGLVRTSE